MGGISGDFEALGRLRKMFQQVSGPELRDRAAKRMGAAALKLVADGFKLETDPYARAWRPLKRRRGKILQDTGRMANAFSLTTTAVGFRISNRTSYAGFHQGGTRNMRRRMMVPTRSRGLGFVWGPALAREAAATVRALFGGR